MNDPARPMGTMSHEDVEAALVEMAEVDPEAHRQLIEHDKSYRDLLATVLMDLGTALAKACSAARFVNPLTDGTGRWQCRHCRVTAQGPGDIEHDEDCPEGVLARYMEYLGGDLYSEEP